MLHAYFLLTATPLLLQTTVSFDWHTILTALAWVLASAAALEKVWGWFFGGTSSRITKLEEVVKQFVPQPDIQAKNQELGSQIAECQGKIKLLHDRGEEVNNGLNMRVAALEQHTVSLTLLPIEVNNLKTDHKVLASKVDALTLDLKDLSKKQDTHFEKLMEAVSSINYTRGQMNGPGRANHDE